MRQFSNLDLMRGFAVSLVVINHTSWVLGFDTGWLGVLGVYLFFIHTSLVLMWSLQRQPHVLNFYIRRVFRIYPLAIVAIVTALVFSVPLSPTRADTFRLNHYNAKEILYNLLLVQNLFNQRTIVGVMWSLTLEVQMYILLPMLFLYAWREKRIWQLLVLWGMAVLAARPFSAGNSLISVLPYFFPGVIAFVGFQRFKPRLPAWSFGLFLLAMSTLYMLRPGVSEGWPVTLAIGLALPFFRQVTQPVASRVFHVIAKYSYGIYLGHPFAIVLAFHVLARHSPVFKVTVELTCTALVAFLGYHLVEDPLIRAGSRLARANDRRESAAALAGGASQDQSQQREMVGVS